MNTKRIIKTLRGEEAVKSPVSQSDIEALPLGPDGKKDVSKLPKETVENVVIKCLSEYPITHKKQTFYINAIANEILKSKDGVVDLAPNLREFLIDVLDYSTIKSVVSDKDSSKKETTGLYYAWVIGQVYEELKVVPTE